MQIISLLLHNFKKHFHEPDFHINFYKQNQEDIKQNPNLNNEEDKENNNNQQSNKDTFALSPYELILINGKNGSGKSTICDALCVAFSKKTYDNKKFDLPLDLQPEENISITIKFLAINNDIRSLHTLKKVAFRNERNSDTWNTYLDDELVPETKVVSRLSALGINGLDNFLVSIHPLYLINPDNASRKESLSLFFKLMNESARPKLASIINEDLKPAKFENNTIDVKEPVLEPLFSNEEIENYNLSPLSILEAIKLLSSSNKSFEKELKIAKDEYLLLEKTSKFLDDNTIASINNEIYNKNNEIAILQKELDNYNTKLSEIKFLQRNIENDERNLQILKNKPTQASNNPTYQKNFKTREAFLKLLQDYKDVYNVNLKDTLLKANVIKIENDKTTLILQEAKDNIKNLKTSLNDLSNGLNSLLDVYYPLQNLNFDDEINALLHLKQEKEEQLKQLQEALKNDHTDVAKITNDIKNLYNEITDLKVKLGNNQQEHQKLNNAKANYEHFRKQNLSALKNQTKLVYLNEAKDKCLNAITEFVNSQCNRCKISLYTTLQDGTKIEDFKILSKKNNTSYYEMNKAEQWLCGYELANLFQSFNNASLPIIFDGAESIDLIEQTRLIRNSFKNTTHQLLLLNVSYGSFKVSGFDKKDFDALMK